MKSFTDADEEGEDIEASPIHRDAKRREERHYREPLVETPSHTGGLSREAKERAEARHRKDRERGVFASSSKNSSKRDDSKHYFESRHSSRDRDHNRGSARDQNWQKHRYRDNERHYENKRSTVSSHYSVIYRFFLVLMLIFSQEDTMILNGALDTRGADIDRGVIPRRFDFKMHQ